MIIRFLRRDTTWAVFLTIIVTVLSSIGFFTQLLHRPSDRVFIGLPHYFEDYYYYLDQFYQGAHGRWLTENRFTTEHLAPTLIYFNHIILGKIGGIFGWESFTSYNFFNILLKFIFLMLSYIVLMKVFPQEKIKRIYTYLIYLFSTSIPIMFVTNKGLQIFDPLTVYRAKNRFLTRFGNIPNDHMIGIYFLIVVLLMWQCMEVLIEIGEKSSNKRKVQTLYKKLVPYWMSLVFVFSLLVLTHVINATTLLCTFLLVGLLHRPVELKRYYLSLGVILLSMVIPLIVIGKFVLTSIDIDPVYSLANSWDVQQYIKQFQDLKWWHYLFAFGPIACTFLLGIKTVWTKFKHNYIWQSSLLIVFISYVGYIFPYFAHIALPAFRFIAPASYLFVSLVSVYGLYWLAEKMRFRLMIHVLITIYVVINFFSLIPRVIDDTEIPGRPDYHFVYMREHMFDGLRFLRITVPDNQNVLGAFDTATDLMIPGIAGKKTYTGHFLITVDAALKDAQADKFLYKGMGQEDAKKFLSENNIHYVFHSLYEGNLDALKYNYPFMKIIYENDTVTIFHYEG